MEHTVGAHSINFALHLNLRRISFCAGACAAVGPTRDARFGSLTRTSLCPRTDMLQRRSLRSRSVGDSRHAWSGALSRRSVVGYSGGLRMIGIGPEDDDAC